MKVELVGKPFRIRTRTYAAYYAVYKCVCGNNFIYNIAHVKANKCKGCGCVLNRTSQKTHGMTNSPEWRSWSAMVTRCNDTNIHDCDRYGGRGITICERWKDFAKFYEDMGPRPVNHTLDRIDVNGDYCPENCRWATAKQQGRNKRSHVLLTYNGVTKCFSGWTEEIGISPITLFSRIRKHNWSVEEALATPVIAFKRNKRAKSDTEKEGSKLL